MFGTKRKVGFINVMIATGSETFMIEWDSSMSLLKTRSLKVLSTKAYTFEDSQRMFMHRDDFCELMMCIPEEFEIFHYVFRDGLAEILHSIFGDDDHFPD